METISKIIIKKNFQPKKKTLKYEWQAFAYKIWADYDKDKKNLANVIRFVKTHQQKDRRLLDDAYNFCIDYTGGIPKIRLFYWKFWEIKKAQKLTLPPDTATGFSAD